MDKVARSGAPVRGYAWNDLPAIVAAGRAFRAAVAALGRSAAKACHGMRRTQLPTRDDLLELPRWARVAFAVRCARLVQPLLIVHLPNAGARHVEAVERAIRLAEDAASEAPERAPDKVVIQLHAASVACSKASKSVRKQSPPASAVLTAAAQAAAAAESACCQGRVKDATAGAEAATAAIAADPALLQSLCQYFSELQDAARAEGWTDKSAIPKRLLEN